MRRRKREERALRRDNCRSGAHFPMGPSGREEKEIFRRYRISPGDLQIRRTADEIFKKFSECDKCPSLSLCLCFVLIGFRRIWKANITTESASGRESLSTPRNFGYQSQSKTYWLSIIFAFHWKQLDERFLRLFGCVA